MILDSEKQKSMLLELINAATYPGIAIDDVYALKKAIQEAEIKPEIE